MYQLAKPHDRVGRFERLKPISPPLYYVPITQEEGGGSGRVVRSRYA